MSALDATFAEGGALPSLAQPASLADPMARATVPRGLVQRVIVGLQVDNLPELFDAVALAVHPSAGKPAAQLAARLARRHARQSVALGGGVALPHAVSRGLSRSVAVFVRLQRPLPMSAPDGAAVSDLLALVVPWPGTLAHGHLLSSLAQVLMTSSFRAELRAAGDTEGILRVLTGCDED